MHLRSVQLEQVQQIQQRLHASIAESADYQGVVPLQFEVSEAHRSIGRSSKGRVSPIGPKRPLRRILDAIEPLIILQECVHNLGGDIREASRLWMHQAVALHAWIRANWSPIWQRLATGPKGAVTTAGAELIGLGRQIAQDGEFLSWLLWIGIP